MDPLPKEEDIHKAYESYYTHSDPSPSYNSLVGRIYKYLRAGYLSRGYGYFKDLVHWWQKLAGLIIYLHPGRRAVIDSQIMEVPAGVGRLLDIGCGNGRKLELLGELGWDTHGVEQDPGAVENCRSKNLNVRCGTLLEQQYEAGY
ncbi:MAG: class I SAM-dependent methyltransferase, partial [Nitrospinota bacterium]|nr:class I SAM-dependent methyltransferase [Nitrospinota bacterium]